MNILVDKAGWRRFAISVAVIAAILVLFAPTTRVLVRLWLDTDQTTYTHGFLIAGISLWLLWRGAPPPGAWLARLPAWPAAVLLLGCALLWEVCFLAGIQLGGTVLLPVMMWAAIFLVQGAGAARAALFPLAFLFFAIPVWDAANGALQAVTVAAVRLLLRLTDVPAFVSGNLVQIRGGSFQIVGGCSGLHFAIVALALGALLGELRGDGWRRRLYWLALGLVLAVLTNWLRVYTIILAGHLTDMQHYIVRVSHYGYGWMLFAIAVAILFFLERQAPAPSELPDRAGLAAASPVPGQVFSGALGALLIAAIPVLLNLIIGARMQSDAAFAALDKHQEAPAGWQAVDGASDWRPVQVGADRLERRRYRRRDTEIEQMVAWYRELAQGRELGGFENQPGGDAEVLDATRRVVGDRVISEQRLAMRHGESLVWIEYRVAGRRFAGATEAQLWYGWTTLRNLRSPPSRVQLMFAPCVPDCDTARAGLGEFLGS